MPNCDHPGCTEDGEVISRLSPEGFLVATGKKAYSFREAYRRFHYCMKHHDELMTNVYQGSGLQTTSPTIILLPLWFESKSYDFLGIRYIW